MELKAVKIAVPIWNRNFLFLNYELNFIEL